MNTLPPEITPWGEIHDHPRIARPIPALTLHRIMDRERRPPKPANDEWREEMRAWGGWPGLLCSAAIVGAVCFMLAGGVW